ncbi:hypothetical protein [Azospirillum sp.]|uniref:hypothetical protein n=1 Tax=Azospirillum sp. TaxID=34012 RepID=UPI002D46C58F|nr:hypothetical protein [Azospirillum sp.]HYD68720.1 hypothetical protein [Azospirillum sp.]
MRAKWGAALLVTAAMMSVAQGAAAADRQLAVEPIELWAWRGQHAVQAPAVQEAAPAPTNARLTDVVLSGRSFALPSDLQVIRVATAPDASARPMPDHQTSQMMATPMLPAADNLPDDVRSGWGCLIGGTVGTGIAMAANAENLINVIAGGIVAPASPAVLAIGLAGVVFGTFCTLGQAVTPLYVHYFVNQDENKPPKEVAMSNVRPPANKAPDVVVNLSGRR